MAVAGGAGKGTVASAAVEYPSRRDAPQDRAAAIAPLPAGTAIAVAGLGAACRPARRTAEWCNLGEVLAAPIASLPFPSPSVLDLLERSV